MNRWSHLPDAKSRVKNNFSIFGKLFCVGEKALFNFCIVGLPGGITNTKTNYFFFNFFLLSSRALFVG